MPLETENWCGGTGVSPALQPKKTVLDVERGGIMNWRRMVLAVVALLLWTGVAFGQSYDPDNFDVYKYSLDGTPVPDVDKLAHGGGSTVNTCWQAAASNILAAAGYGASAGIGATAQQRADHIYTQLRVDLGVGNPGFVAQAVNYWLYTHGKNPDNHTNPGSPNLDYDPLNPYTDVTDRRGPLVLLPGADYDFLLDELDRCQYVTVDFYNPDHVITLVGGNYWGNPNNRPDGNKSIWHDSDLDAPDTVVNVDDDVYTNAASGASLWTLSDYPPNPPATTNGYTTLCPGLNKPEYAVMNYDVAYYRMDEDQNGVWEPDFRVAGAANYGGAQWVDDNQTILKIYNEHIPDWWKEVWLLVDYIDQVAGRTENILLGVPDPAGGPDLILPATSVTPSDDNGQLLFYWQLDWQPPWEQIIFPDNRYSKLYDPWNPLTSGDVKDWDVATICYPIPEPATLCLLTAGLGALAWIRRRRHV